MSWWSDDTDDDDEQDFDEASIRVRPNPKGNKPRTKTRPGHEDALTGRILSVDRGRYTVMLDENLWGEVRRVSPEDAIVRIRG